jgi:hypothetical protein
MTVRLIKHEAVPDCGSYEVRFSDGRPSVYFYFDDVAGRRVRSDQMDRKQALRAAQSFARFARAERDKLARASNFPWPSPRRSYATREPILPNATN